MGDEEEEREREANEAEGEGRPTEEEEEEEEETEVGKKQASMEESRELIRASCVSSNAPLIELEHADDSLSFDQSERIHATRAARVGLAASAMPV